LNPTGFPQVFDELTYNPDDPEFVTPSVSGSYVYGHVALSERQWLGSNWVTSFFGCDGAQSVRYLTDSQGQVTDTFDYDAYGNLLSRGGSTPNIYLYQGEQFDPDLGLYYMRSRYADPDRGRFWSMDSFEGFGEDPASLHAYTWNQNDPVNRRDPSGHDSTLAETSVGESVSAIDSAALDDLWASSMQCWVQTALTRGIVGAGVGAVLGGGVSEVTQLFSTGNIDPATVVKDAISGAGLGFLDGVMAADPVTSMIWSSYQMTSGYYQLEETLFDPNVSSWRKTMALANFVFVALPVIAPDLATSLAQKLSKTFCFPAGTEVWTENGPKDIEQIQAGDLVWSADDTTGETALKRVARTFTNIAPALVILRCGTNQVAATPAHPFWVANEGWKAASDILPGDQVFALDGHSAAVTALEHRNGSFTVYNFEVEDYHSYYVGREPWLVHNACNLASPQRTTHILHGDATGGGHLYPGLPGKSPFPKSWNGDRIMSEISDVATDPSSVFSPGRNGRTIVTGTRDGVNITVILETPSKGGGIATGFPTNVPRNP
jgi:RHS repeat-associated protein